jgi:hypothetical protein
MQKPEFIRVRERRGLPPREIQYQRLRRQLRQMMDEATRQLSRS